MKKLTVVLTKRYPLSSEDISIEIVGGSKADCDRVLTMAENAVLNGWMAEIEDTEEGETDEAD